MKTNKFTFLRYLFVATLLTVSLYATPADDFIIKVKTNNPGVSNNDQFTIPITRTSGPSGTGGYSVDCDDNGTYEVTGATKAVYPNGYTCDYSTLGGEGNYTIRVQDNNGDKKGFRRIRFYVDSATQTDTKKLLEIKQWGTAIWSSMTQSFRDASNLTVTAADIPDFSDLTSLRQMFQGCTNADINTTGWNTGTITNLSGMFRGTSVANPDVSGWNTGTVTNMSNMFQNTLLLDPNVSSWNTSNVTNMKSMFLSASVANPNVQGWDVSQVTDMTNMFRGTSQANPDVSSWQTSSLEKIKSMFNNASSFDRDMSGWDVSKVTDASTFLRFITLSLSNYNALLSSWGNQTVNSGIVFHGGNSQYCTGKGGHDSLTNTFSWTITDGGKNCGGVCASAVGDLTENHWTTISFPCATGNNGVEALIGTAICNGVTPCSYGDNDNWIVYEQRGNYSGTSASMIPLLAGDKVEPGKGYWIISDHDNTWHIDGTLPNLDYSSTVTTSSLDINDSNFDYVHKRDLPATVADQQKLLLGNPFPHDINMSDIYFSGATNPFYPLANSNNNGYVNAIVYTYDAVGTSSSNYKASVPDTPGFSSVIHQQGFWLRLKPGQTGDNNITFPKAK